MPTAKKAAVIDELTEKLGRINAAALIEYRGLTVTEIGDLRTQLRQREVELQVTKNTLLREAAHRNHMDGLDDLFNGPTAVAFIYGDESTGTKALNDYFRTARVGEIKSGILKGGRRVTAAQLAKLADLPNRQTLLAQIAGLLQSPLAQLAALFNAPAQQLAYALAALEEKGGTGGAGLNADTGATSPAPVDAPALAGAQPQAATGIPAGAHVGAHVDTAIAHTDMAVAAPDAGPARAPVVETQQPGTSLPDAETVDDIVQTDQVAASDISAAPAPVERPLHTLEALASPTVETGNEATPIVEPAEADAPAGVVDAAVSLPPLDEEATASETVVSTPLEVVAESPEPAAPAIPPAVTLDTSAPAAPMGRVGDEEGATPEAAIGTSAQAPAEPAGQPVAQTIEPVEPPAGFDAGAHATTQPPVTRLSAAPAASPEATPAAALPSEAQEAQVVASEGANAPESAGGAGVQAVLPDRGAEPDRSAESRTTLRFTAPLPAETGDGRSGQDIAQDVSEAPESAGSADARPGTSGA